MKVKSHSGAKKRFKLTGTGKAKFNKAAHRHLMIGKSKRQKRGSRHDSVVHESEAKRVRELLKY